MTSPLPRRWRSRRRASRARGGLERPATARSFSDKTARIHKFADGGQVFSLGGHTDQVYSVAFNAASKRVAAGSYTGEVRLWNTDDGKETKMFIAAPGYAPPAAK